MPINVMDAHYRSFQGQVVPVCLEKKVGVIGMKGYGASGKAADLYKHFGITAEAIAEAARLLSK